MRMPQLNSASFVGLALREACHQERWRERLVEAAAMGAFYGVAASRDEALDLDLRRLSKSLAPAEAEAFERGWSRASEILPLVPRLGEAAPEIGAAGPALGAWFSEIVAGIEIPQITRPAYLAPAGSAGDLAEEEERLAADWVEEQIEELAAAHAMKEGED